MTAFHIRQVANAVGRVAGETELGRVMQHQDGAGNGCEPGGGGRDMPGKDDAIIEPGCRRTCMRPSSPPNPDRPSGVSRRSSRQGHRATSPDGSSDASRGTCLPPTHAQPRHPCPCPSRKIVVKIAREATLPRTTTECEAKLWVIERFAGRVQKFRDNADQQPSQAEGSQRSGKDLDYWEKLGEDHP